MTSACRCFWKSGAHKNKCAGLHFWKSGAKVLLFVGVYWILPGDSPIFNRF